MYLTKKRHLFFTYYMKKNSHIPEILWQKKNL